MMMTKESKELSTHKWNVLCPLTMLTQPKLNQIFSRKSHDNLIVTCTHKYLFVVLDNFLLDDLWICIRGKIQNVSKSQRSIHSLLLVYSTIIHFFLFIDYPNYFALNTQSRVEIEELYLDFLPNQMVANCISYE